MSKSSQLEFSKVDLQDNLSYLYVDLNFFLLLRMCTFKSVIRSETLQLRHMTLNIYKHVSSQLSY